MVAANNPPFFGFHMSYAIYSSPLTDVSERQLQFKDTVDYEYERSFHKQDILSSESFLHAIKD